MDSVRTMSEEEVIDEDIRIIATSSSKKEATRYKEGGKVEKYAAGKNAKVKKDAANANGAPIKADL